MKILHTLWSARFGGIERVVFDLVVELNARSNVVSDVFFGQATGQFLEKYRTAGIHYYDFHLSSGYDFSLKKCYETIKIFQKYDIIHIHTFNPFISLCAVLAQKKIVYTVHGNFGLGRKKTISDFVKKVLLKWFLVMHVSRLTCNSCATKDYAKCYYKLPDKFSAVVIYNGVKSISKSYVQSTDEIHKLKSLLKGSFVVGSLGRFVPVKQFDLLIRAFALFSREKEAYLLLVGDGIEMEYLRSIVSNLKLCDRVLFVGYQSDVFAYINLMDICVFPSAFEPFGLVAIESYSAGKPVVVMSNSGGLAEIVSKHSTDDVVHDEAQLIRRLDYYYFHRDVIRDGQQGRIKYSQKYDISIMAERFEGIYQSTLE